jgi:hypothetical protein
MKYLVPVARGSLEDCQQMAEAFARHKFTSRQAGQLYAAWREASPQIRQRLLEQPQLFLKVQRETEPAAASPLQELLRDLEMIAAIAHRANRRLRKMHDQCEPPQEEQSEMLRHSLALGLQELQRLATRIPEVKPGKEEHVESESTHHDSGTAPRAKTRDLSQVSGQDSHVVDRPGMLARSNRVPKNLHAVLCVPVRPLAACVPVLVRPHGDGASPLSCEDPYGEIVSFHLAMELATGAVKRPDSVCIGSPGFLANFWQMTFPVAVWQAEKVRMTA